ncbi:unnamed protein product [Effrenium voratum]|nr:unnamed protein product [Effrenium voratum]
MAPCTKGVHMHRQECTAWTTQSVKETVVLVDTKGWEFEGNEGDLFADCLAKAEREKIRPEVLHQRLVLVLVLGAENRHEISDSRFLGLVKRVCLQASEAAAKARGERPVLLPIVSKQDLIDTYIQKATSDGLERVLNTVVGDIMNVQAPVFATNKSSACIVELRNQLASICRKQLASTTILRAVQESTEEELLKLLESWDEKGIDAAHSLARRYVWVVARHRGLRMKSLYHKQPFLSWDTAKSLVKMLRDPNLKVQQPGKDDWHTDELRKTKLELEHPRGHGKPNPNELEHPKKLGKPESPSELEHPREHGKPNPNKLEHPKKLGKPESPSELEHPKELGNPNPNELEHPKELGKPESPSELEEHGRPNLNELEHPREHGNPNPNELEHPKELGKPKSPSELEDMWEHGKPNPKEYGKQEGPGELEHPKEHGKLNPNELEHLKELGKTEHSKEQHPSREHGRPSPNERPNESPKPEHPVLLGTLWSQRTWQTGVQGALREARRQRSSQKSPNELDPKCIEERPDELPKPTSTGEIHKVEPLETIWRIGYYLCPRRR